MAELAYLIDRTSGTACAAAIIIATISPIAVPDAVTGMSRSVALVACLTVPAAAATTVVATVLVETARRADACIGQCTVIIDLTGFLTNLSGLKKET